MSKKWLNASFLSFTGFASRIRSRAAKSAKYENLWVFIRSDAHVVRAGLNIRGCGPLSTPNIYAKRKIYRFPLDFSALSIFYYVSRWAFLFSLLLSHHQLTRTHKVLGAKQHGITVSSSFEIQPVFLHSSSLFCHTLWLLKLEDPKELVLRAIQGRGAQYYWM